MSNRRQFFAVASVGAAVASLGVPALAARWNDIDRHIGGSPTRAEFERLKGQDFVAQFANGRSTTMRLRSVKALDSAQPLEQFWLVMQAHDGIGGPGGLCTLFHPRASRIELHLAPSGDSVDSALYRADFSLLV